MSTVSYQRFTGTAAENYQRDFVPTIATAASHELLRAADLQPGERVVDVACGTGLISRLASELVGTRGAVTGIDIAPDMIDVAKKVAAPGGAPIEWRVADAAAMPIEGASVDVVLCQMGLMFMEDRAAVIAEMARVLTPSGRVAINTPGRIQPMFAALERAIVNHISPDLGGFVNAVFSMHDPGEVAALLRGGGFREVSAHIVTATFRLPPPAEFLWQYINLTPMAALVQQASEHAKAATEKQFVTEAQAHVVDTMTVVDQPMVVATGHA
ncbi:class I SAM-dependent methyltransferase [Mycobacterium sp. NPDC048908]|uniref:class I SAM-dependent methyltransferase n=1 Tax=Mycobacterium sp. NPDC048908 TaxID=3364292 RepID=UPI0037225441